MYAFLLKNKPFLIKKAETVKTVPALEKGFRLF